MTLVPASRYFLGICFLNFVNSSTLTVCQSPSPTILLLLLLLVVTLLLDLLLLILPLWVMLLWVGERLLLEPGEELFVSRLEDWERPREVV